MQDGSRRWPGVPLLLAMLVAGAQGSTPRWTTGPPYFTVSNTAVVWYTDQPLYFTDPGDLSASVDHAAADAMVAAAASVWSVPSSRMVLAQGGLLDEPVSGANVYLGASGLVFPADVQRSNYAAKQIAIVYDRDGSVTDLLLGSGASDPAECRQSAVTESVDGITPAGFIQHAVLVLNGRCTGPAPEQQVQMQYQLERAFGRILGLGWSQLNDNVFTGTPQPTRAQALHWPIMHPIDLICGPYSYQCLPQPFTLRDDDVASITMLYPAAGGTGPYGRQPNMPDAATLSGGVYFPGGEGMAGVNVVVRRNSVPQQVLDGYDDVSAVTGMFFEQTQGTPMLAQPAGMAGSLGSLSAIFEQNFFFSHDTAGYYYLPRIPLPVGWPMMDELMRTEAINPLYVGAYSVGPYTASTVTPSGASVTWRINGVAAGYYGWRSETATQAATNCSTGGDGTAATPSAAATGGWWSDVICGTNGTSLSFRHTAWSVLPVQANRTLTVEVAALDESGLATANKLRPVIGIWSAQDAVGGTPSAGLATTAFNSVVLGMTSVTAQSAQPDTLRIAIADERGDGRPDYGYQARILYADTLLPATGSAGTQLTLHGMGFRAGNVVTVGGVTAQVSSWTATAIVAVVPYLKSVQPGATVAVDIAVTDPETEGLTVMAGAFAYAYSSPVYTMQLVSAPSATETAGITAAPSFTVRMLDVDGVSPLAGAAVVFSAVAGSVRWSACGAASCTVVTNAQGLASVEVTPLSAGTTTVQAAALGALQTVSWTTVPLVRTATASPATEYIAASATVSWQVTAVFLQQGVAAAATPVVWSVDTPGLTLAGAEPLTDAAGVAGVTATAGPLAAGVQATASACAWVSVCGGFQALAVDPSEFVVVVTSGGGQTVSAGGVFAPVAILVTDAAGDPVAGAAIVVHQVIHPWTAPCPPQGRCPQSPVLQQSVTTATTDSGGRASVTPLVIAGPEVTEIVVTSGAQGFAAMTLLRNP